MSDYCYGLARMEHIVSQAELMDRMLERCGVDPTVAAQVENGMALYEARTRCLECPSVAQCKAWLTDVSFDPHPKTPDFCPNELFFRDCKPTGA
ncbi:MAG: DUF6455 family protein [Hyphomicrobiaceae bacterium]